MDKEQGSWHALFFHLIDTGLAAKALWKDHLSESFKSHMREIFNLNDNELMDLICFWVSLHDIGKAGPAFQRKSEKHKSLLENEGIQFPDALPATEGYHGLATTWILRDFLLKQYDGQARSTNRIAIAIGGHHGEFPLNQEINKTAYQRDHLGDGLWFELRNEMIHQIEKIFHPPSEILFPTARSQLNMVCLLLAGLTTTADWIASNETYFPYQTEDKDIGVYIKETESRIPETMEALGWKGWKPEGSKTGFQELFPDFQPNQLQDAFFKETENIKSPFLVILEAPTGSGKTEAALYLTDATLHTEGKGGFYIAMPSQATSNQMFKRTVEYLEKRFLQNRLNVQLIHGAALLNEFFEKIRFTAINQDDSNPYAQISSEDWFQPRKRTLLAPFGVGTVDQAFLAVMRCRHFFLRLFGLSHKVVIFDEVHAYDVYMLEIFKRLLHWLRSVNTSVIILSATLPQSSRQELAEAYHGSPTELTRQKFPRATICSPGETKIANLGQPEDRRIRIDWIEDGDIETYLQDKLSEGGNAAVIGNRVKRTQQLFDRIQPIYAENEVCLFHSRFPACWRAEIERQVTENYGKNCDQRPERSVLIATQVVEQSLDLDFDIIISDVAPVDLLIQRIGRLHRHAEREQPPKRPARLANPTIALVKPTLDENGMPSHGDDRYIYARYLLERTYFALRNANELLLPAATDELIEEVYAETYHEHIPAELWPEIRQDFEELTGQNLRVELKAKNQLIGGCQTDLLGSLSSTFADEHDPLSFNIIQAVTRNARPAVELVCLEKNEEGIRALHEKMPIDLATETHAEQVKACLFSTVRVSEGHVVKHFLAQRTPDTWKKKTSLRTRYPVIFENGLCRYNEFCLMLDRERGLQVLRAEK